MVKWISILSKGEEEMNAVVQKFTNICRKPAELTGDKSRIRGDMREIILRSVLSIALLVMSIWGYDVFNQLLLYDDEFGYWTASAYLTGTDWRSVTSGLLYYSYGYGFLILTPIRLLFSSTIDMYQAGIVANGLLLVGSFLIACYVARQIFQDMNRAVLDIICFVVMLYPSNTLSAHITWAECLLVFVFWVFVWLSMRVVKRPTIANHIGLAVVTMIMYVVHQRTIAVLIATGMILIWCFFADPGRRKAIIVFALVWGVLIVAHCMIKSDLINSYYYNNLRVSANNMDGQIGKLADIFTWEGFCNLLKSIIGKWLYLFVATFMMAWWGAEELFRQAKSYLSQVRELFAVKRQPRTTAKVKNRSMSASAESADLVQLTSGMPLWYMWLLLAFAGNFMVAAIYMGGVGTRNDQLLYGRYNEYMIGIYFVIGIVCFLKDQKWLNKMMVYMPITLGCGWLCQSVLNEWNTTEYQAYHSICTSLFLEKGGSAAGNVLPYAVGGFALSILFMLILKGKSEERVEKGRNGERFIWVKPMIIVLAVIVLYMGISYKHVYSTMTDKQSLRIINIRNVVDWIERIDDDASQNVYYCKDTESRYWSESFQFLLKETPLSVISSSEINPEEDAFYIVGLGFLAQDGFEEQYYCIKKSNQFALVVHADQELAATAREFVK